MSKIGHNVQQPKRSRAKTLVADTSDSSCFDDLRFKAGVAYATFTDGSQYEYDIDRATFKEWMEDSLGGFFNAVVREPTGKK
ncbi:MAG: hypothetical protein ABSD31_13580 [Candidatus Binataceae bacterium]|jgi:hypothetical protein